MRPDGVRIQALVWRTFTPAIVIVAVALGVTNDKRVFQARPIADQKAMTT